MSTCKEIRGFKKVARKRVRSPDLNVWLITYEKKTSYSRNNN